MPRFLAAAVALTLVGCGGERPRDAAPAADTMAEETSPRELSYLATDYAFEGPAQAPAGVTTFKLRNSGKEPHHLVVIRLEEGRTFDSLTAALRNPGPPPRWMHPVGGPNGISGGEESNAELTLRPGAYALICFVPTIDGQPHFAKGMVKPLQVTAVEGPPAAASEPDLFVTLTDYDFEFSTPPTAGHWVVEVKNGASQMHEVVLARLAPGRKAADLVAWGLGGRKGEAPGTFIGGAAPMAPGESNRVTVELEAGNYGLICFVHDAKDGKPHTMHGMAKDLTVS